MASSSGIRAGGAWIELSGDEHPLVKSLNRADKALTKFGTKVAKVSAEVGALGAGIGGALAGAAAVFNNMGSSMLEASQRTGIAVEALSALKFAAGQSDVEFDSLLQSIGRMQKSIAGVADQAEGTTGSLDKLGLSAADLSKLSPDEQFLKIADAITAIQDPAQRTAAAMSVFGKSGAELLPFFADGSKGVHELVDQAKKLGIVMSGADASAADKFGDALSALNAQLKAATFQIGAGIGTAATPYVEAMSKMGAQVLDVIKKHRELSVTVGIAAAGLVGATAAASGFGFALIGVGKTLGTIATGLGLILTPAGAITATLVAGTAAWLAYTGTARQTADFLGSQFADAAGTAKAALKGIGDAIKGGEFKLAGQIAATEFKLAWVGLGTFFTDLFDEIKATIVRAFVEAIGEAKKAWADFGTYIKYFGESVADTLAIKQKKSQIAHLEAVTAPGANYPESFKQEQRKALTGARADLSYLEDEQQKDSPEGRAKEKRDAEYAKINAEVAASLDALDKATLANAEKHAAELKKKVDALKAKLAGLDQQAADAAATADKNSQVDKELEDFFRGVEAPTNNGGPSGFAPGELQPTTQPPTGPPTVALDPDALTRGITDGLIQSRGLFNIGGLQGLQGGIVGTSQSSGNDFQKQTAENTKKTADALEQIARSAGGQVFA